MGFVNSLPGPFELVTYQLKSETIVNGQITGEGWTTIGTFAGKFQRGSIAQSVVSDQFKPNIAGILFVDPVDLPSALSHENYRLSIGGNYYSIIYVDNIENISVEIPLKLWS